MFKIRTKMPPSQRAKQFTPFDAVVGLRQALKEKEKIKVPRKEISEDMAEEINRALKILKIAQIITVVYYNNIEENYIQITGKVNAINTQKKLLQIESLIIYFNDINEIKL